MQRKLIVKCITFAIVLVGTTWLGCKKDEEVTNPTPTPTISAPTNLRAFSAGPTSVGLVWNLSVSESEASFNNYLIKAKDPSGTVAATVNAAKGTPDATVGSLTEGVIYTFVIRATGAAGVVSSDSASVQWSPARRYTTDSTSGPPIQVYELRSTLGASGLQFSASGGYARVRSLSAGNPDRTLCDIYVDSVGGGSISLRNVTLLSYPRNTLFSTVSYDASDLNDPRSAPPDMATYQLNRIDLPTGVVTQAKVYFAKSATDNKYVRILVQRNTATNLLYFGTGSDRYVRLQLSYQNTAGNWFAKPERINNPNGH